MNHVESTMLKPLKKKTMKVWTNRVMHFGNTTKNINEYAHGRLKQYFGLWLGNYTQHVNVAIDYISMSTSICSIRELEPSTPSLTFTLTTTTSTCWRRVCLSLSANMKQTEWR